MGAEKRGNLSNVRGEGMGGGIGDEGKWGETRQEPIRLKLLSFPDEGKKGERGGPYSRHFD